MHTPFKSIKEPFAADKWYELWEESLHHYNTMMDNTYTDIGISVYHGVIGGEYYSYAVTIFAKF